MLKKSIFFGVFSLFLIFAIFPADVCNYYDSDGPSLSILKTTRSKDGKEVDITVRNYSKEDIIIYKVDYGEDFSFDDKQLNRKKKKKFDLVVEVKDTTQFTIEMEKGRFPTQLSKIKVYAKTCYWE
jgi:hypothetical protein